MTFKKSLSLKLMALLLVSVSFLSACEKGGNGESPEVVIQKFKQSLTDVESGKVKVNANVSGSTDDLDANGETVTSSLDIMAMLDIAFDHRADDARKGELTLSVSGSMKEGETELLGSLEGAMKTIGEDYYVILSALDANDPRFATYRPFVQLYMGKWYHIASDLIPENVRELQTDNAEIEAKREAARKLFLESKLFNLKKDHGIETLNGMEVYHYELSFDEEGVRQYIMNSGRLEGRELTQAEIEEAAQITAAIGQLEVWIGTKDYYAYKAIISLTDEGLVIPDNVSNNATDMLINITIEGSDYGSDIEVVAPEGAQEFNPLEVLMGASNLPIPQGEAMMDGGAAGGTMLEGSPEAMDYEKEGMVGGDAMIEGGVTVDVAQ